jgi:2-keto-3-deoxy-L-rhamnonate aldolase RhmA
MVPMIETVEQAEKLAFWGKYMPVGGRGFGGTGDHTQFDNAKALEYMPDANKRTLIIAQIETALAIENLEGIAAVDGIDALLVGPNDLANSLGIPGDLFHEKNIEAIKKTARLAKANGKVFGLHGPEKMTKMMIPEGLTMIMSNHDSGILLSGMKDIVKKFKG